MNAATVILWVVSLIAVLSFVPKWKNTHWVIRDLDFIKVQLSVVQLIGFGMCLTFIRFNWFFGIPLALLILALYSNIKRILVFTSFNKVEVQPIKKTNGRPLYSLLIANVFQDNTNKKDFVSLVTQHQPTFFVTLESNKAWEVAMHELEEFYPFSIKQPLENYYGIHFYSKLPLLDSKVQFIYKEGVPSIVCEIMLEKEPVVIYCVHPEPPSPTENTYADDRDAELLRIAKQVRRIDKTAIVCGDMNDVAWSNTTDLFKKLSGLLDPRVGRGFYSTFSANLPKFLQFPVDHVFCTKNIHCGTLKNIRIEGSDHLGVWFEFDVNEMSEEKFEVSPLSSEEKLEIVEKINPTVMN